MGITIEEFVSRVRWDTDSRGVESFENSVNKVGKAVLAVSAAVIAGATALAVYATRTAQTVAVQTNLANAMDVSAERMETWGYLLGAIGGGAETAQKAFKVLNDRMGELAQGSKAPETLTRAVGNLNLKVKELKELAPEDQFEAILQAAQDATDGQLAMSAATELLGRDGVRLAGFVRTQTRSVRELLEEQAKMNLQTEEGRMGAVRLTAAMDNLGAIWESATGLGAGLFGKALSPLVEKFNSWVAANRELVQTKVDNFVEGLAKVIDKLYRAFVFLQPKVSWFFDQISKGIKVLGGFEAVLRIAGFLLAGLVASKVLTGLKAIVTLVKAGRAAAMLFNAAWFLVPIVLALIAEDIYQFVQGNESLIGEMIDGFKKHYDRWVEITEGVISEIVKDIAGGFGASEEDAQEFLINIDQSVVKALKSISAGIDTVVGWLSDALTKEGEILTRVFDSVSDTVNRAIESIKNGIDKVIGYVRKVPGLGSFGSYYFDTKESNRKPGEARHSFPTPQTPPPSAGSSSVRSSSTQQTNHLTQNITQMPGESGESLANRVSDGMNQIANSIKKNTNSGVVY